MVARLREGLSELYEHSRYRQHLSEHVPSDGDLSALIYEAEAIVVDQLRGKEGA